MKNLPAKNRELGNLIKAAIRMMLLDGHTELGFGNCTFSTSGTIIHLSFKRLYFFMDYLKTHSIFKAYLSAKSKS